MGNIFTDLFSSKPAEEAAKAKAAGFANAKTDANASLDAGIAQATPLYDQAYGDFSTLGAKFGKGQDLYNDATGVNGADAATRAAGIYRSLPGYSAGRDMGINDLERRAAARGDLGVGSPAPTQSSLPRTMTRKSMEAFCLRSLQISPAPQPRQRAAQAFGLRRLALILASRAARRFQLQCGDRNGECQCRCRARALQRIIELLGSSHGLGRSRPEGLWYWRICSYSGQGIIDGKRLSGASGR
ncbi:hypothetical protein IVB34_47690 [Bradyrhizobium sp. 2]|uniref:hypothetical protein n=1 Tax=Bradyrhizobium sp. 2 TaxID=190045 RepID=UPI001FF9CB68|nr:hypothetical protein [Bradyrhizobium sp. 2]MCK1465772.1 hypothetical protein [Bradyrhizobium sp. 2]